MMLKKYYILALTFLCLFLGQVSYGLGNGDYYGDEDEKFCFDCVNPLKEVEITPEPKDEEPADTMDPCDPRSSAYDYCICHYPFCEETLPEDTLPDDDCPTGDYCECYGICPDETEPVKDPCTTTCPVGFTLKPDCSCVKKVDDDCKESKKSTEVPGNSNTFQKGDVATFNGPFYFSDLNQILKGLTDNTGTIVRADLVAGYQILEHGNYYEVPSISYKYNQFSDKFNGGSLGGFQGKDCPGDNTPPPTVNIYGYSSDTNDTDTTDDSGFYQNTGDFSQNSPLPDDESKAGGVTRADAKQLQSDIFNVLDKSPKFNKFKALITRGVKNNKAYFSKIPQDKLDEALNDLDEGDQKVFATIVANTINSDKPMTIQYFTTDTLLKYTDGTVVSTDYNTVLKLIVLPPAFETACMGSGDGLTSSELLALWGSGATTAYNGGIFSFLDTTSPKYNETIALHEFFGHGRPKSIESPTAKHDQGDAIRFENLVWRLLGKPEKQNDGSKHADQRGIPMTDPQALPTFR